MLGIVERILAALIILALLTLLIILAFPVPPRTTPGTPPGTSSSADNKPSETKPATETKTTDAKPIADKAPAPAPEPASGAPAAPKQDSAKPVEPAPAKKTVARWTIEARPSPPPGPRKEGTTVVVKNEVLRPVETRETRETRIVSRSVVSDPPPPPRRRVPLAECDGDCGDCCCDRPARRPYWARPARSYLVERERDDRPYWAGRRWAQIPAGACPE